MGLKYEVKWDENSRCIILNNSNNIIKIYPDSDYCEKDGTKMPLNGSIYINENFSYCSLSFLENIIGIEVVLAEKAENGTRINRIALKANDLPASSRKPFPETLLSVDGKPLYIGYYEDLKKCLPYDTVFLTCDGINGNSEQVVIYTEAVLNNFKISSVKYNDVDKSFRDDKIIVTERNLVPPVAILLNTTIPEGIPMEAVTLTDSKGIKYTYLLSYNGKDGSVYPIAVTLK